MYSIYITYRADKEKIDKLAIWYDISGISIDGNMVRLYQKDGIDKQYNYDKIKSLIILGKKVELGTV